MSLGFVKIINEIEAEIKQTYIGSAISWADEKHDGAWSAAINRFEKSLTMAIERQDYRLAEIEGAYYNATVLDLIRKYKTAKNISDTESFLDSLGAQLSRGGVS